MRNNDVLNTVVGDTPLTVYQRLCTGYIIEPIF